MFPRTRGRGAHALNGAVRSRHDAPSPMLKQLRHVSPAVPSLGRVQAVGCNRRELKAGPAAVEASREGAVV